MESSQIVETRMTEEPERDLDVVVGKSVNEHNGKSKKIAVINPAQGMDKVKAWYVSQEGSSNSNGSKNNPYSINKFLDISQDITKKGDIIVLSGEDGDIYLDNKYISLKAYQQIISSYKNGHAMIEVKVDGQLIEEKFIPEVKTAQLTGTPPEVEGMIVFFSDEGFN